MSDSERLLLIILTALACPLALPFLSIIEKGGQHMNKPLSEWTLGEIQAECEEHKQNCESCPFYSVSHNFNSSSNCKITRRFANRVPEDWDLSEPPRWTEQEAELAKALYELRRSASLVIGRSTGGILWWRDGDRGEGILPHKLFPSLNEGNCVRLDEIIGGGE